eukprot:COSAG01_NODE_6491_length_3633_cov_4.622241_6_plen_147_part_00
MFIPLPPSCLLLQHPWQRLPNCHHSEARAHCGRTHGYMFGVSSGENRVTRFRPRTWQRTPCQASKCRGVMHPADPTLHEQATWPRRQAAQHPGCDLGTHIARAHTHTACGVYHMPLRSSLSLAVPPSMKVGTSMSSRSESNSAPLK